MIMPFIYGDFAPEGTGGWEQIEELVVEGGVGGIIISVGSPGEVAIKANRLQALADVPLLVALDSETGLGFRLDGAVHVPTRVELGGATTFPSQMALGATGDPRFAFEMGRVTATEAKAIGVHVAFAPVLDVNNNPDNPIINTRSFGEDPAAVSRMGAAFIRGLQQNGVMATGKHFPGHGDTGVDSHVDLPIIAVTRERMDSLELVPFRTAVQEGIGGIMTAHIAVPDVSGEDGTPSTLSFAVMSGLLREEMGFEGLVFTDALSMAAIDRLYERGEAAVLAVEAGSDVILMPPDAEVAVRAIEDAVLSGRIPESRIDESVLRLLEAKAEAGLDQDRFVDPFMVPERVGTAEHMAVAQAAADESITLLRNRSSILPLRGTRTANVLSVTYRRESDILAGKYFDTGVRATYPRLVTSTVTAASSGQDYGALLSGIRRYDLVLVSLYVTANPNQGEPALPEDLREFIEELDAIGIPHVVTTLGSPYLLAEIPSVQSYMMAWSGAEVSQRAAVRALFGEIAIQGKAPIRIPPFHEVGDGLMIPARPRPQGAQETTPPSQQAVPTVSPAEVDPQSVGMSAEGLARIDAQIRRAIRDSVTPGAAVAVIRRGELVRLRGFGRTDWAPESGLVTPLTLYDLASLTKVVGTTSAMMALVDDGRVQLDDPIVRHMPEWDAGDARKSGITIRDLMLHQAGLPPFLPWWRDRVGRDEYRSALDSVALDADPGAAYVYSDLGFITLGLLVETVTGVPLDAFLTARVFGPLGLSDTGFRPDASELPRIAPTEIDTIFRMRHVHGEVHDENAFAIGGVSGSAGLFSSASDLAGFVEAMMTGERFPIRREVVDLFTRQQSEGSSRALGWDTPSGRSSAGDYFTEDSFGHTGFTGTSIWVDKELDLAVVLLTNRVNPTRAGSGIAQLRRDVADAAALAVTDRTVARRGR